MSATNRIVTRTAEISRMETDFIRIKYKADVFVDVPDLEENLKAYRTLTKEEKFFLLTVISPGVTVSLEARNTWSKPERSRFKIAEAFVIKTLAHKILANFVVNVQKPKHKLKFFTDEKSALTWLEKQRIVMK